MTHLVVDVRMHAHSGIGRYIRELVPRVAAARPAWAVTLVGDPAAAPSFAALPDRVRWVRCDAPVYSIREQWAVPRAVPRDASLLWVPHYNIPLAWRGPLAVTVHDTFHLADPAGGGLRRAYARLLLGAVRRRARAILTVSAFTRDELRTRSGPSRVEPLVVHSGVGAEWFAEGAPGEAPPHGKPYLLYVGNVKPHKNLSALLEAFAQIRDAIPHDLVLVGRMEGMRTTDRAVIARARGMADRVLLAGEVDDHALRRWVRGAALFVMPSLYEGFGLPPLEAMAAGVPCLVSRAASLPEVCGEGAAYVDAQSSAAMAASIVQLLRDDDARAALAGRGRAHARRFTWERAAEASARELERAMTAAGTFS